MRCTHNAEIRLAGHKRLASEKLHSRNPRKHSHQQQHVPLRTTVRFIPSTENQAFLIYK